MSPDGVKLAEDVAQAQKRLTEKQAALAVVQQQVQDAKIMLQELETDYQQRQRPERPHSK
jgi:hypothetical protein